VIATSRLRSLSMMATDCFRIRGLGGARSFHSISKRRVRKRATINTFAVMSAPEDAPATKADLTALKADVTAVKADVTALKADVTALKADVTALKGDLTAVKADVTAVKADVTAVKGDFSSLRQELLQGFDKMREYIDERTRDMQTELLRGFADYSQAANIRFLKLEADTSNINTSTSQRLGELEKQMTELRARVMSLETQRPRPPQ
jgi:chromosome segregation ATPase